MSRYLVFSFEHYYPGGGINDLQGSFGTLVDAFDYAINRASIRHDYADVSRGSWYDEADHAQVYDLETRKLVLEVRWSSYSDRVPALTYHDLDEDTKTTLAYRCRDKYRIVAEDGGAR